MAKAAFIQYTNGADYTLSFDAIMSVTHVRKATPTEHAVEKGANISDHIKQELDTVSFDAVISNEPTRDTNDHGMYFSEEELQYAQAKGPSPLNPGGLLVAGVNALGSLATGPTDARVKVGVKRFKKEGNYVSEMFQELVKIMQSAQLCEVITTDWNYENMALISVDLKRKPEEGTAGIFALEFRRVRVVDVAIVPAPKVTQPRANKPKSEGSKSAEPLKQEPTEDPNQSVASALRDKIKGFFK